MFYVFFSVPVETARAKGATKMVSQVVRVVIQQSPMSQPPRSSSSSALAPKIRPASQQPSSQSAYSCQKDRQYAVTAQTSLNHPALLPGAVNWL